MLLRRSCGSKHTITFIRFLFMRRSTSFLYHANCSRELYNSPKQHPNSTGKLARNPAQPMPDNKLRTEVSLKKRIARYMEHLSSKQTRPRVVNQGETSPSFATNFNVFALQVHLSRSNAHDSELSPRCHEAFAALPVPGEET